jgi:hypothetical protein
MDAITQYKIMALPRRILDLKELGVVFITQRKTHPVTGQRYTRYVLVNEHNAA